MKMEVTTTNELINQHHGNKTIIAHYCGMNRAAAAKHLDNNGIVVIDGEVYIKKGKVDNSRYLPKTSRKYYWQFIPVVQSILSSGETIDAVAELMCESHSAHTRDSERRGWIERITNWISSGEIVV